MQAKRIVRILLLPALAFIFAIGWIFYAFGSRNVAPKKPAKKNVKKEDALSKSDSIEIGIIEMPKEEEIATKKRVIQ